MFQPDLRVLQFASWHDGDGEGDGRYLERLCQFRVFCHIALHHFDPLLLSIRFKPFIYQLHQHLTGAAAWRVEVYKDGLLVGFDDRFIIFICKFHEEIVSNFCYNCCMENILNFELKQDTVDNLHAFSELLKKDVNQMLEEALEQYFDNEQKKLIEKGIEEDATMTNLDYDEFWDDVELD